MQRSGVFMDRLKLFVLQPVFKHFKFQPRRHPKLQLEEAIGLAEATEIYSVSGSALVNIKHMNEGSFFSTGKLDEVSALLHSHQFPHQQQPTHLIESGADPNTMLHLHETNSVMNQDTELNGVFINTLRLSPRQQHLLEDEWGLPIYDRFKIILDIFETRAQTREAKVQVALARIPYEREHLVSSARLWSKIKKDKAKRMQRQKRQLARLQQQQKNQQPSSFEDVYLVGRDSDKEKFIARTSEGQLTEDDVSVVDVLHSLLAKNDDGHSNSRHHFQHSDHTSPKHQANYVPVDGTGFMADHLTGHSGGGGGGGMGMERLKGDGESWSEKEKQKLNNLERKLKHELKHLNQKREMLLANKAKSMNRMPVVAIIGYTNAGKTALVRRLSGSEDIVPRDMLFATLDTAARVGKLPNGTNAIFVDTVGFVSELPHQLVEAFKSTLSEIKYADLMVHITDTTDPDQLDQQSCVLDVLHELGIGKEKIDGRLQVFSKHDLDHSDASEHGEMTQEVDFKFVSKTLRQAHSSEICDEEALRISVVNDFNIPALQLAIGSKLDSIFDRHEWKITMPSSFGQGMDILFKHGIVNDTKVVSSPFKGDNGNEYLLYQVTTGNTIINKLKAIAKKASIAIKVQR
eukprot:m.138447 g.138447  ORF g.138447 m.138447 type:complete len:631 (-) comp14863_c0_seq1:37-1929(-)